MSLLILDRLLLSSGRRLGKTLTVRRFAPKACLQTSSTWSQHVSQRQAKRLEKPRANKTKGHQGRSGLNSELLDPSELLDFRQALHQASQELSQPAVLSGLQACVPNLLRLARHELAEAGDSREVRLDRSYHKNYVLLTSLGCAIAPQHISPVEIFGERRKPSKTK